MTVVAFKDPGFRRPTPIRIEGDLIYGHFCAWDTMHIAVPGVRASDVRGDGRYRYFHLGGYDHQGQDVDVGSITLHTTHAPIRLGSQEAIKHYEDTGAVAAYVRAGNDAHGGWFCGKLRKGISDEDREALLGAKASGDWRGINGRRELIGILAVNIAGFPIERERVLLASGQNAGALVASGIVPLDTELDAKERLRARVARIRLNRRLAA